jgi:DHA2 family multidrug resistance protein
VGIAILSTIVTQREQLHDFRIGESITVYDTSLRVRLAPMVQTFIAKGIDPVTAQTQAYGAIKGLVRREANIMAFNDAFLVVGWGLIAGEVLVWFCKKPGPGSGMGEG